MVHTSTSEASTKSCIRMILTN